MELINWHAWDDSAFEEAKRTGKPVLLDVSAVWCHWCHVMDETTYSDPAVVDLINEYFVPIRVDTDREPDINARYNMGGWPTTAFLTHNRDVIAGATYVPPYQMVDVLRRLVHVYKTEHEDVLKQASEAGAAKQVQAGPIKATSGVLDVESVVEALESAYDPEFGGFGSDQKFPFTPALQLLLLNYERTKDDETIDMVVDTLEAMLAGQIFDSVEGGMFRYATQRDWTEPHYEKMLDDNARMAMVLLDAYRLTDRERYLEAAKSIFTYMENVLMDSETGTLYGSQDADEDYYRLDAATRKQSLPPRVDKTVYVDSNATAALAYLRLWSTAGDRPALDKALRVTDCLNGLPRAVDGTVGHYIENGQPRQFGNLADVAGLAMANLVAYEATGDAARLDTAKSLIGTLDQFSSDTGGLYDITETRARERGLRRQHTPFPENSAVAITLIKLADITDDGSYSEQASHILDSLATRYMDYGLMAADYAIAVSLVKPSGMVD